MSVERIPITSRDQWLGLRSLDVTASQIGALFGCHPYSTIGRVHLEKIGMPIPGPDRESQAIRRGIALEPVVAAQVQELRPEWKIEKFNEYYRDPILHLGATPDFLVTMPDGRRAAMQTKTVGAHSFRKWIAGSLGDDDDASDEAEGIHGDVIINPPFWITLQDMTESMLTECDLGIVAVLVLDAFTFDTHIVEVPRHEPSEQRIREAVAGFWDAIAAGDQPMIDPARDADLVRMMYPEAKPESIIDLRDNPDVMRWLERREITLKKMADLKAQKNEAVTALKLLMQDKETAIVPGWRMTHKMTDRKEHLVKASRYPVLRANRIPTPSG